MHTMPARAMLLPLPPPLSSDRRKKNNIWHNYSVQLHLWHPLLALSLVQWAVQRATLSRGLAGQPSPQSSVDPIHWHHAEFCDTAAWAPGRTGR